MAVFQLPMIICVASLGTTIFLFMMPTGDQPQCQRIGGVLFRLVSASRDISGRNFGPNHHLEQSIDKFIQNY